MTLGGSARVAITFTVLSIMEELGYSDWAVMVRNLQGRIADSYADPATGTLFVRTAVAMGSLTVNESSTIAFSEPAFEDTVQVEATTPAPTAQPVATSAATSSENNSLSLIVVAAIGVGIGIIGSLLVYIIFSYCSSNKGGSNEPEATGKLSSALL
jgi:hypothetical protein